MAPGVLAQGPLAGCGGQRPARGLVHEELVRPGAQLRDAPIQHDLAPRSQVAGDVRLRIRELGRADGGELEYPHVGAGAIARGVPAPPGLLVEVHSHGGTRERAHQSVAVDRAPWPSRPPDDETE